MESKKKAEALVESFIPHTKVFHEVLGWEEYRSSAVKCAVKSVKNIMEEVDSEYTPPARLKFWEEVLTELNKM